MTSQVFSTAGQTISGPSLDGSTVFNVAIVWVIVGESILISSPFLRTHSVDVELLRGPGIEKAGLKGGTIVQWLAYLLADPAAPDSQHSPKKLRGKIIGVAEANKWHW